MKLQRLLSLTRQAVDEFHMIEEGDKIAVGISGGKDSGVLLNLSIDYIRKQKLKSRLGDFHKDYELQ